MEKAVGRSRAARARPAPGGAAPAEDPLPRLRAASPAHEPRPAGPPPPVRPRERRPVRRAPRGGGSGGGGGRRADSGRRPWRRGRRERRARLRSEPAPDNQSAPGHEPAPARRPCPVTRTSPRRAASKSACLLPHRSLLQRSLPHRSPPHHFFSGAAAERAIWPSGALSSVPTRNTSPPWPPSLPRCRRGPLLAAAAPRPTGKRSSLAQEPDVAPVPRILRTLSSAGTAAPRGPFHRTEEHLCGARVAVVPDGEPDLRRLVGPQMNHREPFVQRGFRRPRHPVPPQQRDAPVAPFLREPSVGVTHHLNPWATGVLPSGPSPDGIDHGERHLLRPRR